MNDVEFQRLAAFAPRGTLAGLTSRPLVGLRPLNDALGFCLSSLILSRCNALNHP